MKDRLRLQVLQRDEYRCVDCGASAIEVHHIISRRYGCAWQIKNMISICASCHRKAGSKANKKRHLNYLRDKYGYVYTEPLLVAALEEAWKEDENAESDSPQPVSCLGGNKSQPTGSIVGSSDGSLKG